MVGVGGCSGVTGVVDGRQLFVVGIQGLDLCRIFICHIYRQKEGRKCQGAYHTIAFICPNNPDSRTIAGTAQSVDSVESFKGYDFFGSFDDGEEEGIEDEVEVELLVR